MTPRVTITDDSPRPIVLLAATLLALVVVGIALPLVGFLLLAAVVYLGAAFVAYVLFRMVVKFIAENSGDAREAGASDASADPSEGCARGGGVLTAWRPGVFGGLRVAAVVLALWVPFGLASVLVFGANGFVVHLLGNLAERTVDGMQAGLGAQDLALGDWERKVRGSLELLPLPGGDTLRDAIDGVRPTVRSARDALVNLLQLVRFALVVESYVAWIFLLWLTVRSVLYFLARTVLAEHLRALPTGEGADVRFDMGLLRARQRTEGRAAPARGDGNRMGDRTGDRTGDHGGDHGGSDGDATKQPRGSEATQLRARAMVHERDFALGGFDTLYARVGLGPNRAENYRFPQWTSCAIRRVLTNAYHLNRIAPAAGLSWPVRAPARIVVVELRGERLCVRMRHLAFFERSLQLSTIVNAQIPWAAFESPLVTCIEGHGRVGLRVEGEPMLLSRRNELGGPGTDRDAGGDRRALGDRASDAVPQVNLPRLAAWSADTRLEIAVEPGYSNAVLVAAATAEITHSSLVVAAREDGAEVGSGTLLSRIARLVIP